MVTTPTTTAATQKAVGPVVRRMKPGDVSEPALDGSPFLAELGPGVFVTVLVVVVYVTLAHMQRINNEHLARQRPFGQFETVMRGDRRKRKIEVEAAREVRAAPYFVSYPLRESR